MAATRFISAIGTPLNNDGSLHVPGLEAHMEDQWQAGINGLLVAGTMGLMQMQSDEAYGRLVAESANLASGRGEVMIGVGDTSFARTRDRIELVNRHRVDAVVVLTPYFVPFGQEELVDYFRALADIARHPLYLYDLPGLTGVKLSMETVQRVAEHPNIHGIKCSCEWDWTRQLIERIGDSFRVVVAQPLKADRLIREGVGEQLDGIFSAAPEWTIALGRAADAGEWETAAELQGRIAGLLDLYAEFGGLPAYSAILNARGVTGNFAPAPYRPLSESRREQLLDRPLMRQLVADCRLVH